MTPGMAQLMATRMPSLETTAAVAAAAATRTTATASAESPSEPTDWKALSVGTPRANLGVYARPKGLL